MGLFDKLLGTTASDNSIGNAEQNIACPGEYYIPQASIDLAAQQRLALMYAAHTQCTHAIHAIHIHAKGIHMIHNTLTQKRNAQCEHE
jgi:hypothetical protein